MRAPVILLCCVTACGQRATSLGSAGSENYGQGSGGPALPGAVTDVRVVSSVEFMTVFWTPAADNGSPITGYLVEEVGVRAERVDAKVNFAGFRVAGGVTYCYRVYALTGTGRSPPAPGATCGKAYASSVAAPLNPRATAIPRGARITWDAPPQGDGPPIGSYGVEANPYAHPAQVYSNQTSVDFVGLAEGATYVFNVRAWTNLQPGLGSVAVQTNPVTVRTVWPDIGAWQQGPTLPEDGASAAFMLGGKLFAMTLASLYASNLDADGRPTGWTQTAHFEGIGYPNSAIAVYSPDGNTGFAYVTGGSESYSGNHGEVWVARIDPHGAVGSFARTASIDPGPRSHSAAVVGRHLYVAGGSWWSGGSYTGVGTSLPLVQVADIAADGTLGPWRRTQMLPRAGNWRVIAQGQRLYALSPHAAGLDVLFADAQDDGSLGEWRRASAQPDTAPALFGLVAAGDRLYLAGSSAPSATVLVGKIGPDGDVTAWESSPDDDFNGARAAPALGTDGRHLYLLGGFGFYDSQWATIDAATGHLAPFKQPARPHAPSAPLRIRATVTGTTATVQWDAPADDGGLPITGYTVSGTPDDARVEIDPASRSATFSSLKSSVPYTFQVTARNAAGEGPGSGPSSDVVPFVSARWRPVPGGQSGTRSPVVVADDLFVFGTLRGHAALPLDAGGMPWTRIGPGWQGNASTHGMWAQAFSRVDERTACAYQVGGDFWTIGTTNILCLRADGFFGELLWRPPPKQLLDPTRRDGAAVVAGSFLYALGGLHGDPTAYTTLEDVSVAPILADGDIGPWAHTTPLPAPSAAPMIVSRDRDLYLITPTSVLRAHAGEDGALSGWRATGPTLPVDPSNGKVVVSGDFLYLVTAGGSLLVGHLDPASGDVVSWELDPADALPMTAVAEVAAAPDRLYVFGDSGLVVGQIDPATGRTIPWP